MESLLLFKNKGFNGTINLICSVLFGTFVQICSTFLFVTVIKKLETFCLLLRRMFIQSVM